MKYYTRQVKKYQTGDIIFSENSQCDGMYIIDHGRVRVFKTVKSGSKPKEVELCVLGPKSMFGEMAMIDESRRSASVQALEPTACTIITKKIFEDQLANIPPWMVNLIKILVSRLRETNEKLRGIIEEQTEVEVADSGMLTVEEDHSSSSTETELIDEQSPKESQSEKIIRQIFDK
ncbi:MAG: cyclic nucleotide-binding domain-containing protein [Chitinivibrionales bacterium]|nr:cyclic nucleotide-binding domain-containing protein [Chitinivibrionales bacterium]